MGFKTCFGRNPVASNVKRDFLNLVDVYCDAVFHPNLTPMTLKQEGYHLDFAEPGERLGSHGR